MSRARERQDAIRGDAEGRQALCVWMLAGVVSYRLCNRAFDCDHCPLDRALREGASGLRKRESLKGLSKGRSNLIG